MTTNNEVYAVAKKHLGHHGSHARAYCGLGGGQPYCCAFVCMCFHGAKAGKLFYGGKRCTYCPAAIMWCEDNLAEIPPYLAMRMDLIFFDWQPNGTPDHIGFVLDKISTDKIRTLEGNTSGGIVAIKTRGGYIQGIFRPHYKPDKELKKGKLTVDGDFGYHSIYMLQAALGITQDGILGKKTVKALQKKVGAMPDGAWGPKTSRQIQAKLCGFKGKDLDGEFGPKSVQALQRWANSINYPSTEEKPAEIKSAPTAALKSSAAKSDTAASKAKTTTKKSGSKTKKKATSKTKPELAVEWARKIAKSGKYTYKKWNNKDKKTKLCPICHPSLKGKYKGWNCIGFVSAAWYHGAGLKTIECSCKGIGTDSFFTKVSLNSWRKRNGKNWNMISVGSKGGADIPASKLKPGDILICYDAKGKFHHIALYTGNSKYIDCTNTSKNHIAERPYSKLCKKYHVTRAFRYTGK